MFGFKFKESDKMAQKKATYKVYNGSSFDEIMLKTLASQVIQDATHRFITDTEKNNIFNPQKNFQLQSGYVKLPNGLILQWGNVTAGNPAKWIAYPIQFPNGGLGVQLTGLWGNYNVTVNSQKNNGFEALAGGSYDCYYLAIGY